MLAEMLLFGCKKSEDRVCFKSAGPEITRIERIKKFKELIIEGDFDIDFLQDSLNYIEITGGKNLVGFLFVKQKGHSLSLDNNNKCDFLRSFNKRVKVTLHFEGFTTLLFNGAGNLNSKNILAFDTLEILNDNSSGSINWEVKANNVFSKIIIGTTDINIRGKCNFSYAYNGSFGWINHKHLITHDAACFNNGSGTIEIYSDSILNTQIKGTGNVYAYGSPKVFINDLKGQGKLVLK